MHIDKGEVTFSRDLYPDIAKLYASKKCKTCYGRGLISIRYPGENESRTNYCKCVDKNMRKEEK
tara:strand:- start:6154 stop:6345 length:192 start_codon:yes stop_codon:yes gene_type:complete